MRRREPVLRAAIGVLLIVSACGGPTPSSAPRVEGSLTVLAAASLTAAFQKIGDDLHANTPGVDVKFSFAGSPTLVTQIQQGAPADVFASADQVNMQKVVSGGFGLEQPQVFAHNKLEIAVQAGNPRHITSVSDLTNPAIKVDVCAPGVPCGTYATTVFGKAGVRVTPVSEEQDVKSVLTKVGLGEADAGIVYVTDVQSAGSQVQGVTIPDGQNTVAAYPIVALKTTTNQAAAKVFIDYVESAQGQEVLANYGFMSKTETS